MGKMNGLIKRGAFIVFEGCDRSGKSTQSKLLVEHLKKLGHKAQYLNFPNRNTECGKMIDAYLTNKQDLRHETIHLLFTMNRWELQNQMKELLQSGITLVVDRYSFSGVAFSAAKGLDLNWCKGPEAGLLKPDMVFFMQIKPSDLEGRNGFGEERYETTEFQGKVLETYSNLRDNSWHDIDASRSKEEILKDISGHALSILKESDRKNLEVLWDT